MSIERFDPAYDDELDQIIMEENDEGCYVNHSEYISLSESLSMAIEERDMVQSALDDLSKRYTTMVLQNSALAAENEVLTAQNSAMNAEIYKRKADLETIHKALILTKRSIISDSEGLIEWAKQEVVIRQWKDHESEQPVFMTESQQKEFSDSDHDIGN